MVHSTAVGSSKILWCSLSTWHALLFRFCGLFPPSHPRQYSRTKTLPPSCFIIITTCTLLNSFRLLLVQPLRPVRLVPRRSREAGTPDTCIISTCCTATKPRRIPSSPPIQGLPHARARVSAAEPNKVYPLLPVLIVISFGNTICSSSLRWWRFYHSHLSSPPPAIWPC
ncbi:hypothetical protein EDB85DRAFT_168710 [Lactarius pseudohatsudake]|nr:hypothetical protein EDB85DRAFT_168710 [Lactarius pseudohatsudake]